MVLPMAPRAYWKGHLKLSLVSCPIQLYPAVSQRETIGFHLINRKTGNRIKYRKVDAITGDIDELYWNIRYYIAPDGRDRPICAKNREVARQGLRSDPNQSGTKTSLKALRSPNAGTRIRNRATLVG
jgi:non-homologous end joining protein Ku